MSPSPATPNSMLEIFKNISFTLAGGALWGFYLHWRGRTFQKKLLMDVKASSRPAGERHLLFVEVQLTNAGKVKLQAKQTKLDGFVYSDEVEQLRFSCSLQIKRVNTEKLTGPVHLDWYRCPALESPPEIPAEINLLDEYLVPGEEWRTVFWLEPGDIAHLCAPVVLTRGHYLLKTSFYGSNPDKDFWSRLTYVQLE